MLNPLVIESSAETPEIILDQRTSTFIFKGKSLPENPIHFYGPVMQWLENYTADPNPETKVEFMMMYFNTSSSKIILDIMKRLENIKKSGHQVSIIWKYKEDDEEMLEAGEIYAERVSIPFNIIPVNNIN